MADYEPRQAITGLGCALIAPTLLFGTAMLAEESGPGGWRSLAEFLGWWTLCVLIAMSVSSILKRRRVAHLMAGITGALAFFLLAIAEAQPETPNLVKDAFTTSLQVLGVVGALALIALSVRASRASYKS